MRNQHILPISLLAFALVAPAAMAAPSPSSAFAAQGNKEKDKDKQKDKSKDQDRYAYDDRGDRGPQSVPPGQLPPAGQCRVWYDGRPPGHQPAPTDCTTARREAERSGGRVIYGDNGRDDDRYGDWRERFDRLDRNDDGYLSSREWTGDARTFDVFDRNNDGRLSRAELQDRDFGRDGDDWRERFDRLDRNDDGYLSSREWTGDSRSFDVLDRNNDNRLSRAELQDRDFGRDGDDWRERFDRLDRNDDGYLSSREWTGDSRSFDVLDRNNDNRLSRAELQDRDFGREDESRFRGMDDNRDGRLSRAEWSGRREDFDRLDRNDDSFLSLSEWLQQS